ncbi:haloacid dehalogenase-like hydrolase [Sorangium sp. So ce726]|uniref:HAD family hydrolase n=1 Tax=Sorangium sp. So ce726 TaxID=3133319 RepID=UPI003F620212
MLGRALNTHLAAWILAPLSLLLLHCGDDESVDPVGTTAGSATTVGATTGAGGGGGSTGSGGGGGNGGNGGNEAGGGGALPDLDPALDWYGDNRQRLDGMIDEHGASGPDYDPDRKPVAVFDWDNTVIKNDVGDATMFWMLLHDKILQPPGGNWALTSPYLTAAAVASLGEACGAAAEPGEPLPTGSSPACADEILSVYVDGETTSGEPAFAGYNHRTMEPAYAWLAQLGAGYSADEITAFAGSAIRESLAAEEGAVQTVGTRAGLTAWLRIYDPIRDLIGAMQKNGFDVWVVSASPQSVVEPFAERVNIAADRVIGIRQVTTEEGVLTYDLQGCGPVPDGTNAGDGEFTGNSLITFIEGKRCWINKVIFGESGPAALEKNPDASKRPVFGAGDSDTDLSFLQDATALRLAINRNKKELMCNAYRNHAGTWLINPMFILPKGHLASGYACSTTACVDEAGAAGPCLDEAGAVIPDQADNVY